MSGIKDLGTLLKSMKPEHIKGTFVFCTVPEKKLVGLEISPILIFRESEGITIVVEKEVADKNSLRYEG